MSRSDISLRPYVDQHQLPSANISHENSTFQADLESQVGFHSPSITPNEHQNALPLLEIPSHRGTQGLSRPKDWRDTKTLGQWKILRWINGRPPYRKLYVKPALPQITTWIQIVSSAWLPGRSLPLSCGLVMLIWVVAFAAVLVPHYQGSSYTQIHKQSVRLACDTRLWRDTTFCGYDGLNCGPFSGKNFTFICPADCTLVQLLEPHIIGDQEVVYRNMVVGGASSESGQLNKYRGDSFICQAAIHAGIVSDKKGGCGRLTRIGEQRDFVSTESNGVSSISFAPSFPLAYTISPGPESCTDPQWKLLAVSTFTSVWIAFLATTPEVFLVTTSTIIFFQVALASDHPFFPDLASMVSMAVERFLPTIFVVYTVYRCCLRQTLKSLQAHLEKAVLWTGGCWVGALNNYTFDRLPISRLTIHDLQQQPGAVTTLVVIIVLIVIAAIGQVVAFRSEGRLLKYILFYAIIGLSFIVLGLMPSLQFRLHHYIIALLLLPGTSLQTRRSLLYQGLLFGLLLNGIARWGFASILETADALREDGQLGGAVPEIPSPEFIGSSTIRFAVNALATGFDGLSILVNDVERYHQLSASLPINFEWIRPTGNDPSFFRFAFMKSMPLGGVSYGDFSKTGTWYPNGTWITMKSGLG